MGVIRNVSDPTTFGLAIRYKVGCACHVGRWLKNRGNNCQIEYRELFGDKRRAVQITGATAMLTGLRVVAGARWLKFIAQNRKRTRINRQLNTDAVHLRRARYTKAFAKQRNAREKHKGLMFLRRYAHVHFITN